MKDFIHEIYNLFIKDTIYSKFLIATLSSIFTILIKRIVDKMIERRRLRRVRKSFKKMISKNIITPIYSIIDDYHFLEGKIKSGEFLHSYTTNEYLWLNSSVFDFFAKNDILNVLYSINDEEISDLIVNLDSLDFIQNHSPSKIFFEFDQHIIDRFKNEKVNLEDQIEHYNTCPGIKSQISIVTKNIQLRINQCEDLIKYFEKLKDKL